MLPKYHIIFGLLLSFLVFALFPNIGLSSFFIIWVSSFLIDFDHYLYYVFREKDISLKRARAWFFRYGEKAGCIKKEERKEYKVGILIFHGIEFLTLLICLCFFNSFFFYILLGVLIHLLLDLITSIYYGYSHEKVSQIYNLIRNKNKKVLDVD